MASAKAKVVLVSALVGILAAGVGGVAVVKSLRPADVARTQTIAGNVAPATPASPWTVTFSDGSTADLIGVTDFPDSGKWWAADGTVTPPPLQVPRAPNKVPTSDSTRAYRLVVRHDSPTLRDSYLSVTFHQEHPVYGDTTQRIGPNASAIGHVFALPKDLSAVDLVLEHASGPWQVSERHDLRSAPAPGADDTPNPALRIVSVREQGGGVAVEAARTGAAGPAGKGGGLFQDFVVSSADGQEHGSNKMAMKPDGGVIYFFPVRKDQATTLVQRWRPLETREIHNVSLRPGTKTDVSMQQGEAKK